MAGLPWYTKKPAADKCKSRLVEELPRAKTYGFQSKFFHNQIAVGSMRGDLAVIANFDLINHTREAQQISVEARFRHEGVRRPMPKVFDEREELRAVTFGSASCE
jgi:hypothetical protein